MRTMKIKLGFSEETGLQERRTKLKTWAKGINRVNSVKVLEEKHYPNMSYIVIENPNC